MKIIFFGSSEFAVPVLEALKASEEVSLIVTQPDRKKGRTLKLSPTPVKEAALRLGIKTFQPDSVNTRDSIEYLRKFNADMFIVVSFGQILSKEVLALPELYSLNVHASLLPKYRGAAPINQAIASGEKETGVTIIKMDERMDEGEIALKEIVAIDKRDNAITLSAKLSKKGALLLLKVIDSIKIKKITFLRQDDKLATYAPKLKKEDGLIDWSLSADEIYNRIRAFLPWPGCFTHWNKSILKIWKLRPVKTADPGSKPGAVLEVNKDNIIVSAGKGAVAIEELQLQGKRRMNVEEFIAGHKDMLPGISFC
ncbi:MAG: methionyl-tRNA formyltransferase [Candidatus Omnitrophica bacterium]|nr:methionyl-tRNA formyltransferase [Candidatus Omnitrophota bacterium]